MRLAEGKQLRGDFSQAESCWSNIALVWDVKDFFQVWKVNMKSQIRTKGEIKDSMFKAIALVFIVVGSVTTQWWTLDGSSWAWYAR